MKLEEFIEKFIEHNSLVRLVYKEKGGHKIVLDSWDDVSMEWEILKGMRTVQENLQKIRKY